MARLIFIAALLFAACGSKPKPQNAGLPAAPQRPGGPVSSIDSVPPVMQTLGGVDLTGTSETVRAAALLLATNRKKGVEQLAAAGHDAKAVAVRLLGSAGLNELLGGLDLIGMPNDPTGAHKEAMPGVIALLGHDAPDVRAAASKVAIGADDPQAFIAMATSDQPALRTEAVRLLGKWSGPAIEAALLPLLAGDDELAIEAALALGAPGKTGSPEVSAAVAKATTADGVHTREAGFIVARRLGLEVPDEAVERALADSNEGLVSEATHAASPARLAGLSADARLIVRRVATEEIHRIKDVAVRDPIVERLAKDEFAEVRAALPMSLVKMGQGSGSTMDLLLIDPNVTVRRAALAATSSLPGAEAATRLRSRIPASNEADKAFIMWSLEAVPDRSAVDLLIDNLTDQSTSQIAHIVLQSRSNEAFGADPGPWRAWADKAYPKPPPDEPAPDLKAPVAPEKTPEQAPKAPEKTPKTPDKTPTPK